MKAPNENKGTGIAFIISIIALIFSLGAVYFAFGAKYTSLETKNRITKELDTLINIDSEVLIPASLSAEQSGQEGESDVKLSSHMMGDQGPGMMMEEKNSEQSVPSSPGQKNSTSTPCETPASTEDLLKIKQKEAATAPRPSESGNLDINVLFAKSPSILLNDIVGGEATGKAWLAIYNGITYHRVAALRLPLRTGDDYYAGWLVKDEPTTKELIYTGRVNYNASTSQATLSIVVNGDWSNYRTVVITAESAGAPMSGKHILTGTFGENIDFTITPEMLKEPLSPIPEAEVPLIPTDKTPKANPLNSRALIEALLKNDQGKAFNDYSGTDIRSLIEAMKNK